MRKLFLRIAGVLVMLGAPLMFGGAVRAAVDECTWTGAGADDFFSTAANWTGCDNSTTPEVGDSLKFDSAIPTTLNNNLGGASFSGITITANVGTLTVTGNAMTLTGDIDANSTGAVEFDLDITLGANVTISGDSTYVILGHDSTDTLNISSHNLTHGTPGYGSLSINSQILGSGSIIQNGLVGTYVNADNSAFTGDFLVQQSTLTASDPNALGDATGETIVSNYGYVSYLLDPSPTPYTIAEPFSLGLSSRTSRTSSLRLDSVGAASFVLSGPVTLTANSLIFAAKPVTLTGSLSGNFTIGVLGNSANGTLTIQSSPNTSQTTNGVLVTAEEVYNYSDSQPAGGITVSYKDVVKVTGVRGVASIDGGTLMGTGTVGNINMQSGTVAPGLSPGCLSSGNLIYAGGTVEIELNGGTVCTEYDQQTVTGTIDLGSATTLSISRLTSYAPALNTTFTIISNDSTDAVTGTFAGLAQGATTVVDGYTYTISYSGGDGNDVVLTVTGVPAAAAVPDTGAHVIKSGLILPILAIASALGIAGLNYWSAKKK